MKVAQSCPTLCDPMDCSLPGSFVHGILQAKMLEWVAIPFSRGSSQPRDQTQVSLQTDSLPSEPPGNPKNTGMGSLSLLQWIFPTQGLNRDLLHCRQILHQLSYKKAMTNLTSHKKAEPSLCQTNIPIVKTMVFPIVMYRCESWTIKMAEGQRIDAFELWSWNRFLRVPWTARSNQSILKEINPEYSMEGLMLKLKL